MFIPPAPFKSAAERKRLFMEVVAAVHAAQSLLELSTIRKEYDDAIERMRRSTELDGMCHEFDFAGELVRSFESQREFLIECMENEHVYTCE